MKKKIVWLPYDFDTALGINNEGALVFDYELEDTDHLEGGADVFNGQQSVVWNNLRDAFPDELAAMYRELRSEGTLSYAVVEKMFEDHQGKWSEAIFNEDAYFKYILPLIDDGSGAYLEMLQGSKAEQRKWWLYNRFRYIDSKYNAGDALSDLIQLRAYAKSDITITPYADIYPTVKYGSYLVSHRGKRGQATVCECPLTTLNDTETYIYSASQLASVGDLSGLKVGFADLSMATKLQSLKIGDADSEYSNPNLKTLTLGNNVLLKTLDVRNCPALASTVDVSGCSNIEEIYFEGTAVTGVTLPVGGVLRKLHLPNTITNLTIRDQSKLTDLVVGGYTNISTLRIENTPVDSEAILRSVAAGTRVRLIGFTWQAADYAEIVELCDLLDTMRGLDEQGGNVDTAQVSGEIHTGTLTGAQIAAIKARYPYINPTADHTSATLTYKTYDGSSTIDTETVLDGGNGTKTNSTSRASDAQYSYSPDGWATAPNGDKDANALANVTADRTVYAAYSKTLRSYTVSWVKASADGGGTLQTKTYTYGTTVTAASAYTGSTPTSSQGSAEDYPFEGWNPASATVQGDTTFTAKFGSPIDVSEITDSWDTIIANIDNGTYATAYKIGQYKPLDLGTEGTINMQIVDMDADELADGSGTAPITFISKELLSTKQKFNANKKTVDGITTYTAGGWENSDLRGYLKGTIKPLIPTAVKSRIVPVTKVQSIYTTSLIQNGQTTVDDVWVPSHREVFNVGESTGVTYNAMRKNDSFRIKDIGGSAQWWWLRSVQGVAGVSRVSNSGADGYSDAYNLGGVALGFCLGLEPPTITDSWEDILAAEANGTYKTKYAIGDTVKIDLGTEGSHLFEIVAFDTDDKADGSGKAPITWMSKDVLNTVWQYRAVSKVPLAYTDSNIRTALRGSLLSKIPTEVKNAVVTVTKVQSNYVSGSWQTKNGETTEEEFWIPSVHEMISTNTSYESTGATYSSKFTDDASRSIKTDGGLGYWLRSIAGNARATYIDYSGAKGNASLTEQHYIRLGFCT